jgi:hypothetical protein
MPEFQSMFTESKGKPIVYEGNTLVMLDDFPREGATKFRLVFETCNGKPFGEHTQTVPTQERRHQNRTPDGRFFRTSEDGLAPWRNLLPPGEWRQGVALTFEGKFKILGQIIRRAIVLWCDTADPQTVEFEVVGKPATIAVKNIWDVGNGVIDSWHNGAAMIVESVPNGRRYRCNDGFADDDFNDIVFRLERIESA